MILLEKKKNIGKTIRKKSSLRWDLFGCDKNDILTRINNFILLRAGKTSGKFTWFSHLSLQQRHVRDHQESSLCEASKLAKSLSHRSSSITRYQNSVKSTGTSSSRHRCNNISTRPARLLDLTSNARFRRFQSLLTTKWKSKVSLKQFFLTTFSVWLFIIPCCWNNEKGL